MCLYNIGRRPVGLDGERRECARRSDQVAFPRCTGTDGRPVLALRFSHLMKLGASLFEEGRAIEPECDGRPVSASQEWIRQPVDDRAAIRQCVL